MPMATKEAQREYQRKWRAARRESYLGGKVCIDCGSSENLEIDHRDPTDKIAHGIWHWKHEAIITELAKCDIRCKDCHSKRHARLRTLPCGTYAAYERGCRCVECKKAHATYRRNLARKRRESNTQTL